jgi:copper chaperone CopZ
MKKLFLIFLTMVALSAQAQISKATLQASGLTCSMCSKAVKSALEKVSSVEKVMVDIKSQQYKISFKADQKVELDDVKKAVEDAGFSVAKLQVTANVETSKLEKDQHLQIGQSTFHFLNADNRVINGETIFTVVDKDFVPAKEFKKYSGLTRLQCVQTGKIESCCKADGATQARVYHVII